MKYGLISIACALLTLLLMSEITLACSCGGGANPCIAFAAKKGVIFVGTVIDVKKDSRKKYGKPIKGKAREITIEVSEVFRGEVPKIISTSDDGFRCDNYPFSLGQSYLIYSKGVLEGTQNIVPVRLCSGTQPVAKAHDSIRFLRQMKSGIMPSILYGKLLHIKNNKVRQFEPLPNTGISIRKVREADGTIPNNEEIFATLTDLSGEYEFKNLPPGVYQTSVDLPKNLWMRKIKPFGAGGQPFCTYYSLNAYTNGQVSGKVLNPDGTPASLKVRISSADTRRLYGETRSDEKGNFTFRGLNNGEYKISVSLSSYTFLDGTKISPIIDFPFHSWYFPSGFEGKQAKNISLGYAEKIKNIKLTMPPIPQKRAIPGKLIWNDGTPVSKGVVYYRLRNTESKSTRYVYLEEDGSFSLPLYEQLNYEISVETSSPEKFARLNWLPLSKRNLDGELVLIIKSFVQ